MSNSYAMTYQRSKTYKDINCSICCKHDQLHSHYSVHGISLLNLKTKFGDLTKGQDFGYENKGKYLGQPVQFFPETYLDKQAKKYELDWR